jgi:regulator of RNase E activity RraA
MKLKINLKSFDELPLLDVKTEMNGGKKNNITDILFPIEFANQNICFLIEDEIAYFTADARGVVSIKAKELVKTMNRK